MKSLYLFLGSLKSLLNSSGTARQVFAPAWVCEDDSLHSPQGLFHP